MQVTTLPEKSLESPWRSGKSSCSSTRGRRILLAMCMPCCMLLRVSAAAGQEPATLSEATLLDAFDKGRSLVTTEVLGVRSAAGPFRSKANYYRVRVTRTIVAGDLSPQELAQPIELYAGASFGNALKPGSEYALFIIREGPFQLDWAHRSDVVKIDPADAQQVETLVRSASQAYDKSPIRAFREKKNADALGHQEPPKPILAACKQFRSNPADRIASAKAISQSHLGSRIDPDQQFSSSRRYLRPRLHLSRAQLVSLLGPPNVKAGWEYLWFCGEEKNSTQSDLTAGILSVTFDKNEDGIRLIYETHDKAAWIRPATQPASEPHAERNETRGSTPQH